MCLRKIIDLLVGLLNLPLFIFILNDDDRSEAFFYWHQKYVYDGDRDDRGDCDDCDDCDDRDNRDRDDDCDDRDRDDDAGYLFTIR